MKKLSKILAGDRAAEAVVLITLLVVFFMSLNMAFIVYECHDGGCDTSEDTDSHSYDEELVQESGEISDEQKQIYILGGKNDDEKRIQP